MKKNKFTESQIIKAIKEAENGRPVAEVSPELGINPQTLYS
jgi:putative transposase